MRCESRCWGEAGGVERVFRCTVDHGEGPVVCMKKDPKRGTFWAGKEKKLSKGGKKKSKSLGRQTGGGPPMASSVPIGLDRWPPRKSQGQAA